MGVHDLKALLSINYPGETLAAQNQLAEAAGLT
jgi:hypothetical protein